MTTSLLFGLFITVLNISLSLFFEGMAFANKITLKAVAIGYVHNVVLIFVVLIIVNAFGRINVGKSNPVIGKPALTLFTKTLIIFPGLPLFGLLFSMVFVRLFEIFGVPISRGTTVAVFTLSLWVYGVYKCKTVYFKNNA